MFTRFGDVKSQGAYISSIQAIHPAWPLLVESVSMLVQECSGDTLFSSYKKNSFSNTFGVKQPFSLRNIIRFLSRLTSSIKVISCSGLVASCLLHHGELLKNPQNEYSFAFVP